jgi:hypothetical protein
MAKYQIKLLKKNGWIVECEAPFEIYHKNTNSRATNLGAEIILEYYKVFEYERTNKRRSNEI